MSKVTYLVIFTSPTENPHYNSGVPLPERLALVEFDRDDPPHVDGVWDYFPDQIGGVLVNEVRYMIEVEPNALVLDTDREGSAVVTFDKNGLATVPVETR